MGIEDYRTLRRVQLWLTERTHRANMLLVSITDNKQAKQAVQTRQHRRLL